MMTDPIADMLTRIRNACSADHKWVDMPVSSKKVEIARLLEASHFVHAHKVLEDGRFGVLRVYLKYHDGKPVIRHLERVSRPGRRHYVGKDDIPRVRNGLGMAILSTSAGVLSDRAARDRGVGGEVLAKVW
ncbi:MAG: 30S ribosomal protein S8 [Gemmatimonadota bacterium]|nr:30S ribosomal protein S8 [Gemmatimonadota bacterium]MDH3423397.1 30S ribosomal protein S8 [Gemmatimonadota bacterium]